MGLRRAALTVMVLLALLPIVPSRGAPGPPARCREDSWVAGTVDLCAGELVYRDYVYDDYGADTGQVGATNTGYLSQPAGDQRYAAEPNTADLVELRLRVAGDRLHVSFELNALFQAGSTVAALAIDRDANPSTGGGDWPDLGVRSRGWESVHTFTNGDPATNLITGDIPLPASERWRVQAVTAVTGGPVMNVAFRGPDERGEWWEDGQSAALRSGDISRFGHVVDVADLRGRTTRPAQVGPGLRERVYTSAFTLAPGEGMTYGGVPGRGGGGGGGVGFTQTFHFLGKYQPYGFYLPPGPPPHGLQLALHGYSANHASLIANDGMQQVLGDEGNRILVVPLGRGPEGFYSDLSERDVLDVLADVEAAYPVDRERVFAGGYSMGGYGTLRFASLYPHRFAGYINWVGFTGDCFNGTPQEGDCAAGAVGNVAQLVGNLRHVPGANLYAAADELVHVHTAADLARRMADAGVPHAFYLHPAAEHLTLGALDDWRKEARYTAPLVRQSRPARVTFRTDPALGNADLGIAHDRAYWVSAIRTRQPGWADVDLTSSGCGGPRPVLSPARGAGVDPVPWVMNGMKVTGSMPAPPGNRLEGTLVNVRSLTVGADACLKPGPVAYRITTDGPAIVDLGRGRVVRLPGAGTHAGA